MQAHPAAPSLHEVVFHFHLQHGVHAREGVGHDADERAIAQAGKVGLLNFRAGKRGADRLE
jgi:hypothetical protein